MMVVCGWVYWVIEMTEVHCAGLCVYLWWWFVGGFIHKNVSIADVIWR